MNTEERIQVARDCYEAYVSGDRSVIERSLSDDYTFYSPADVGIDRERYFERCWPNAKVAAGFEFRRVVDTGTEVIVTYDATRTDGTRFRNTEVLTFEEDKIVRTEVYFGWNLD
jgi:ketosteroid isomerase-like protein